MAYNQVVIVDLDLSGTKRIYSENNPKKINLTDEMIETILGMLSSPLVDDKRMALGIIKNCNDDIKYLRLMEKISHRHKSEWRNKDKGGSLYFWLYC